MITLSRQDLCALSALFDRAHNTGRLTETACARTVATLHLAGEALKRRERSR